MLAGLAVAAKEIEGSLPCLDASYSQLKKGRLDWPTSKRVLEFFGAMSRGWLAAGVSMERVSLHNVPWTEKERVYLLSYAGTYTLKRIARRLGRSYGAVRGQLRKMKITSRHNQGFLSAAEIAKEFNSSYSRVCRILKAEGVKGKYDRKRNRWEVDPVAITPDVVILLRQPKKTHKSWPTDKGDYYTRYGLCRRVIDGQVMVVAAT